MHVACRQMVEMPQNVKSRPHAMIGGDQLLRFNYEMSGSVSRPLRGLTSSICADGPHAHVALVISRALLVFVNVHMAGFGFPFCQKCVLASLIQVQKEM